MWAFFLSLFPHWWTKEVFYSSLLILLSPHVHFLNLLSSVFFSKAVANLLTDDRFKVMFENPDYQVDERSEEFRLLNPIVSKVGEKRRKQLNQLVEQEEQVHNIFTLFVSNPIQKSQVSSQHETPFWMIGVIIMLSYKT